MYIKISKLLKYDHIIKDFKIEKLYVHIYTNKYSKNKTYDSIGQFDEYIFTYYSNITYEYLHDKCQKTLRKKIKELKKIIKND